MASLEAILWDVGGPILDEDEMYVTWERGIFETFRTHFDRTITDAEFADAKEWAIQSYAPYSFRAMLYQLCNRDEDLLSKVERAFWPSVPSHSAIINPGIKELLVDLSAKVPMAIVANQLKGLPERLQSLGLDKCFRHVISAGEYGLYKPDLRVFQHALEKLNVAPHSALMVGDRLDNDVVPAKLLGIKTLFLNCGWYENQKVRLPNEQPDYTVRSVPEMIAKLRQLFA